jgi:hypothetical protein
MYRRSLFLDVYLCLLAPLAIFSWGCPCRAGAAPFVRGAPDELQQLAGRSFAVGADAPPGSDRLVTSREGPVDRDR